MGKKEPQMRLVCAETVIRRLNRLKEELELDGSGMLEEVMEDTINVCIMLVEETPTAHEHRHMIYEEKE